jgi:hypothetical protein
MKTKDKKLAYYLQQEEYPKLNAFAVVILGGIAIGVGLIAVIFTFGVAGIILTIINYFQ